MARPRSVADHDLLEAAMHAFWAGGYAGVSTRALEEATGLPASSLYHRYGSKDGLFAAALCHYNARVIAAGLRCHLGIEPGATDAAAPESDAAGGTDALAGLRAFFASLYCVDGEYRACLLANTAASPGPHPPAVRAALREGGDMLRQAFAQCVQRGIAQQQLKADLDPARTADYLLLVLRGLLATARLQRDPDVLDSLVETALAGLRR